MDRRVQSDYMIRDGACSCKIANRTIQNSTAMRRDMPPPRQLPVPTQAGIDIHREQYDEFSEPEKIAKRTA